jgi:ABC-type polysaccharide/polyol phosphate export permease
MFPVFLLCGILPWNWCSAAVMAGIGSIVGNAHLIKKVYFPWELLPVAIVLSNMVHFFLALPILLLMMIVFGAPFTPWIALLPVLMVIQLLFLVGLALLLSCLNVFLRDTQSIMEVLISLWFFLTPVFYRVADVSGDWAAWLYLLNPMASLVTAYRSILYDGQAPDLFFLTVTAVTALLVLLAGYLFFVHNSPVFAEEL